MKSVAAFLLATLFASSALGHSMPCNTIENFPDVAKSVDGAVAAIRGVSSSGSVITIYVNPDIGSFVISMQPLDGSGRECLMERGGSLEWVSPDVGDPI